MNLPKSVLCIVWSVGCIDNSIPLDEFDTGVLNSDQGEEIEASHPSVGAVSSGVSVEGASHSDGPVNERAPECGVLDLDFAAQMRDEDEEQVEVGYPVDRHRIWAQIHNPCEHPVELTTETSCLIEGWRITADGVHPSLGSFPCGGAARIRTIPAGGFIEQEVTPLHDLGVGDYEVSVVYGHKVNAYGGRAEAKLEYEVVSRFGS